MEERMKNSNRPPLFSREIHEKIATVVIWTFLVIVVINMAVKLFSTNFFLGLLFTAVLHAVFVMNYKYPMLRGRRFPWRK